MPGYATADSYQDQTVDILGRFRTWLDLDTVNNPKGHATEIGWSNNQDPVQQADYNLLRDISIAKLECDEIVPWVWATGHHWGDQYNVSFWEKTNAGTWQTTPNVPGSNALTRQRVNYAGHEFFNGSTAPTVADLSYLVGQGVAEIRYPMDAEFIYPVSGGPLDATNLQHIVTTMNNAATVGMKINLDVLHPGNGGNYALLFGNKVHAGQGLADYQDYLTKLFSANITDQNGNNIILQDHDALNGGYVEIANEPQNLTPAECELFGQTIYDWLRSNIGLWQNTTILIPTASFSGFHYLQSNHPAPWITPNAGDTSWAYVCHHYSNKVAKFGDHDGTFWYEPVVEADRAFRATASANSVDAQNCFVFGSLGTEWSTASNNDDWIQWDFGVDTRIYKYAVANDGTNSPAEWVLERSNDGVNWTTVNTMTSPGSFVGDNYKFIQDNNLTFGNGRYWRVRFTNQGGNPIDISELRYEAISQYSQEVAVATAAGYNAGDNDFICDLPDIQITSFTGSPDPSNLGTVLTYTAILQNMLPTDGLNTMVTFTNTDLTNLEYSLDNGSTWLPYTGPVNAGTVSQGIPVNVLFRGTSVTAGNSTASISALADTGLQADDTETTTIIDPNNPNTTQSGDLIYKQSTGELVEKASTNEILEII